MTVVAICTPHGQLAYPDYYRALMEMQSAFPQLAFVYVEVDSLIVSKARNVMTETALRQQAEVLWFIDNDTIVPRNAGILVEQAIHLGVVAGVYYSRRPPFTPQLYELAQEPENKGLYWPLLEYPTEGLSTVDAIGAGCMCVRRDVFEKLADSWTRQCQGAAAVLIEHGAPPAIADLVSKLSPWFEFLEKKGEDMYFSERLREIGQKIWVNYEVKCDHLAMVGVNEQHFVGLRDAGLIKKVGSEVLALMPSEVPNELAATPSP